MNDTSDKPIQNKVHMNPDTTPVLYTDTVFWKISKDGVVLNFGQTLLDGKQVKIVARIGSSREFAKRFIGNILKNLALTEVQGQTSKNKS